MKGMNAVMPTIVRKSSKPYRWKIGVAPLERRRQLEKKMPRDFITEDGFHITETCRSYLAPLIAGEDYPPYKDGLPEVRAAQGRAGEARSSDRNSSSLRRDRAWRYAIVRRLLRPQAR